MKRIYALLPLLAVVAFCAAAQTDSDQTIRLKIEAEKLMAQVKTMTVRGLVTSAPVKGAPFSAVEIVEKTQVLGDGTRIHTEQQTTVYRDSEGRVRRETPDEITISDPVAGTSYVLNPKEHSARKAGFSSVVTYSTATAPRKVVAMRTTPSGEPATVVEPLSVAVMTGPRRVAVLKQPGDSLGKRTIEGVVADGTRRVETIEVGAIGNDRAIQITDESWFSPELQLTVESKHSDPRTGDETLRLTNIVRVEPPANLFQPPPDYKMPPLPTPKPVRE